MSEFFITVIFLAFCITVIALSVKMVRVKETAIKTLGRFPQAVHSDPRKRSIQK